MVHRFVGGWLLVLLLRGANSQSNVGILKTLPALDRLKATAESVDRIQSISVYRNTSDGDIPLCNLAMLMPFSGFSPDRVPLANGVFQGMAALALAIEHLNTGNGTIVEEVRDLNERCDIRFTLESFDTSLSQIVAVDKVIQMTSRDPTKEDLPCAVIGAARSAVSIPTSIITGLKGFPQISPISTSTQLDDKSQFPLFGRTLPSDSGTAVPAILYLRYTLGVKHLAILHVNDAYGNAYALGLQVAAAEHAPDMVLQSYDFPFEATPDIVKRTIGLLKDTQFRYFFGIIFSTVHYDPFMTEAYHQGIAGTGEHNWMFSDSVSTSVFANPYEFGSPLHLASRGATRIGAVGGVPGIYRYDLFLQSMNDLGRVPSDTEYLQSKHPTYPDEPDYKPLKIADDPEFFQKSTAGVVPFLYDAAIALGLAACNATKDDTYFDGVTHFQSFLNTTFDGASGQNVYDNVTGTRLASSARFTLLNVHEDAVEINENGTKIIRFEMVETDVFREGEWEKSDELILNDGTSTPPPDLPPITVDNNYIGTALRAVGLTMSGMILVVSVGFALWTHIYRQTRVVRASQPIFLQLICAGCFLMGSAIIFLSFDDEVVSYHICDVSCIIVPWFFSFGWILSFSALFTKTNRVNQIFHNPTHKRIKVTVWDVMKPVLALVTVVGIIMTLWTILSPPEYERQVIGVDLFGREIETMGLCNHEGSTPYVSTLAVVLLGVLAYAIYEAYVARNVSTEFAESEYIFLVLSVILLVTFLGIPVMILAKESSRARYFVTAAIIFIICSSILLLIFVPKMLAFRREKKGVTAGRRISVTGFDPSKIPVSSTSSNFDAYNSEQYMPTPAERELEKISTTLPQEDSRTSDGDDQEGIRILQHPNELNTLKKRIEYLEKANKMLRSEKSKKRMDAEEQRPLTSSATAINMVGEVNQVENSENSENDPENNLGNGSS